MIKLKFLVDVPDKYTKEQYKEGQEKEFNNKRAEEILSAKQKDGQPYAIEIKEEVENATKNAKAEKAVKKKTTKNTTKESKQL